MILIDQNKIFHIRAWIGAHILSRARGFTAGAHAFVHVSSQNFWWLIYIL